MGLDYNSDNCVISVGVKDYDRSVAWYRDVLGFELEYELKEYGWCELKTPFGFNIGLGQSRRSRRKTSRRRSASRTSTARSCISASAT